MTAGVVGENQAEQRAQSGTKRVDFNPRSEAGFGDELGVFATGRRARGSADQQAGGNGDLKPAMARTRRRN